MNETASVVKARRKVYSNVSGVILTIVLLVLVVVGIVVPQFYMPQQVRIYSDMNMALPMLTQAIITYSNPMVLLLAAGLLGTVLVVKEILAPPKARFWVNVVTLLLLLIWGVCYVFAISLPMWSLLQAMQ